MAKKNGNDKRDLEPQKSSAAQFLIYIASTGAGGEKYEIRYEDENIWMSQKMLAAVYGVEVPNIAYHLRKLFADAELDKESVIKEILITAEDGEKYRVNHYNLQVIIALGFKIDNERAVQFRKWANRIVGDYTIRGYVMDKERFKKGTPLSNEYFERLLEDIREIRLSERKFYQKVTDLYATAVDYDGTALRTRRFFATVQNKMHRAVNGLSAAQIISVKNDTATEACTEGDHNGVLSALSRTCDSLSLCSCVSVVFDQHLFDAEIFLQKVGNREVSEWKVVCILNNTGVGVCSTGSCNACVCNIVKSQAAL